MATYLRFKNGAWYARFQVPPDVREAFDGKRELWKHLGTKLKRDATLRALAESGDFQRRVVAARNGGLPGSDYGGALEWLKQWRGAKALLASSGDDSLLDAVRDDIEDAAEKRFLKGVPWQEIEHEMRERESRELDSNRRAVIEALGGPPAKRWFKVATGETAPLLPHVDDWHRAYSRDVQDKTASMGKSDVLAFLETHPHADDITRKAVAEWIEKRLEAGGAGTTVNRSLTPLRSFWKWLQDREVVSEEMEPFAKHDVSRRAKQKGKSGGDKYVPFEPKEVVSLWKAAKEKDDDSLADLILLGAYTGARIEELCSLGIAEARGVVLKITEAKTTAGVRDVPIHSALKPVVKRLIQASDDGFLLSGLKPNKYGDRSAGIGKRFGRLKRAMGFNSRQVFHSIRKTVTTQLERAGISENVTADIVGHEKPRITYGTYSGGTSLRQRREAVEKIKYPALKGQCSAALTKGARRATLPS
ncbi:hypothetical protein FHP25_33990 [Vineibacter terrae]|uniref:Tyrosine-type recombinase/integrase n=1 Tax=Vineibacter terrae TaxID=2586908 RepID=A0A5C8PAE6_9HYPH|nr:tyrosine-type recombinase/integrase [Vineibacter terrae]TXL70548.1 hypothetical protein FHP25_33990 [Vineibacter terrae]